MIEPTFCSGLADLASRYRGLIVDQWGVLHDGARPYADALDCLARLRAAAKWVVLLSNSGKRTPINQARLAEIGIDAFLYDAVVTSGEATWQALAGRAEPFFAVLEGAAFSGRATATARSSKDCPWRWSSASRTPSSSCWPGSRTTPAWRT